MPNFLSAIRVHITAMSIKGISVFAVLICQPTLSPHTHSSVKGAPFPSVSSQAISAADKIELLRPTGPFPIGTMIYEWVDSSRPEQATKKSGEFRQLVVQVWYPVATSEKPTAPYVAKLEAYRHVWEPKDVEVASRVLTHAYLGENPLISGHFPVVLFSHGWQGTRTEYTSIAEDLASHGFAVFGIDHPYMGRIALPNGQVTEPTEDHFQSPADILNYYGQDVRFVIDRIIKLNAGDPNGTFVGKLQVSRIGVIGHSSGFGAASTACKIDRRIAACANVDGPVSAEDLRGLRQPLLWVRLERAGPTPAEFLRNRSEPSYELGFLHARHGSVEDWDYLEAESYQQRQSAADLLRVLREYIDAFFIEYLQGQKSALLKQSSTNSDMTFKIHAAR
ncbi:MAG TPA: alpha/beta fold hydrolase [Candidatus Eisenbacteria bacterium]|jgi:pimeloyl-ACP methyl ester carboxylesterase|nr:alpha/beta fold hydrolase [Candidatus Eisenbacteria bacterium]